jgi:glycosyltransferase involved in cell wall biosynthesis
MTILHLAKKYPRALGGDAVVVSNLQRQQEAAGHSVTVVTSNCDDIMDGDRIYKVGLHDTPAQLDVITVRRMISLLLLFFQMFYILGKERPDVIHAHSIDMAFFASFAARFFGVPMVHTFHIVTFYDETQPFLRRKGELWLAKRAGLNRITAPNAHDVAKLQAAGLKHAVLLPNGVDLGFWKAGTRVKRDGLFVFLAVGRLERQKGYEYLIRAAALLADVLPGKFRVIIVGDGPQAAALQELIRDLHVGHTVSLVGRKTPRQVHRLLTTAGAAVSPSLYETTPITMLEAWASAVPVIATPVGILRDMPANFDATYMVPLKDARALMSAMLQCMTDAKTRMTIAAKGHREARKYAWPIVARAAESIYRSAV